MKRGDLINGYEILRDFTTAGGGLSKWTFARKGGETFFLKEFLAPTYPTDDAPGSLTTRERKRQKCLAFEEHQRSVALAIAGACGPGGNLVYARDFFRCGTKYYKASDKVDVASLGVADVAALPLPQRLLILKTVAHSLGILHRAGIVHGDLKPDNVLIKRSGSGRYIAKLIDFDSSFFAGRPPEESEDVVGDLAFYSPEMARYVRGDGSVTRSDLRESMDVFALGLLYCLYLTGESPLFDQTTYLYPCDAVNAGVSLHIVRHDGELPEALPSLIEGMLALFPASRPTVDVVFRTLKTIDRPDTAPSGSDGGAPGLRGRLLGRATALPPGTASDEEPAVGIGKLKGRLIRKPE